MEQKTKRNSTTTKNYTKGCTSKAEAGTESGARTKKSASRKSTKSAKK